MSWSLWMSVPDPQVQGQERGDTRGEGCSFHIPTSVQPPGLSEWRRRGLCGCPLPGRTEGHADPPTRSRINAFLLQIVRGSPRTSSFVLRGSLSRANGRSPRAAPAAPHPSPLSPGSSVGCRPGPRPPPPALSPGSSCARSGPGSAPAPQWPCFPITLMSAPLPLGFIGSQPAPPG